MASKETSSTSRSDSPLPRWSYLISGPAKAIAEAVIAHDPLAVALLILHIEWMSQRHYVDSIHDNRDLEALTTATG
jgi:hypothetical protein